MEYSGVPDNGEGPLVLHGLGDSMHHTPEMILFEHHCAFSGFEITPFWPLSHLRVSLKVVTVASGIFQCGDFFSDIGEVLGGWAGVTNRLLLSLGS